MPKHFFCLLLWAALFWGALSGKQGTALGETRDIEAVVRGAVEDESWWEAKDQLQLREMLSHYFEEPFLSKACANAWPFLAAPTDWYTHTRVTKVLIREIKGGEAEAVALLQNRDAITGEVKKGKGVFLLRRTVKGWKIIKAEFFWEE